MSRLTRPEARFHKELLMGRLDKLMVHFGTACHCSVTSNCPSRSCDTKCQIRLRGLCSLLGLLLYLGASARCWGFCSLLGLLLAVRASAVLAFLCCTREDTSASGAIVTVVSEKEKMPDNN